MTTGGIVFGALIGVMVALINEAYRRNLRMEIDEVKDEIIEARLDLKRDYRRLLTEVIKLYEKNKEVALKREVERSNEEE